MADENTNSDVSCISDLEADDNDAIESFFGDLEELLANQDGLPTDMFLGEGTVDPPNKLADYLVIEDLNENPELDILNANDDDEDRHPAYLVFGYLNENLEQDCLDANDCKDINNKYHQIIYVELRRKNH